MNYTPNNNNSRKFVFSPLTASNYSEIQRNFELKPKQKEENSNSEKKLEHGALKNFFDSENSNLKQSRFEWNLKKRSLASHLEKESFEDYAKNRRERQRFQKRLATPPYANVKEPEWQIYIQNSFKQEKNEIKVRPRSDIQNLLSKLEVEKRNEISEKASLRRNNFEKAPVNSLFSLHRKDNREVEKKNQKPDKTQGDASFNTSKDSHSHSSIQKTLRKSNHSHKSSEIKITSSDIKKIRINEILKGHAQKFQTTSTKSNQQIKDYSLQGVTELLQKVKNISNVPEKNKKEENFDQRETVIEKSEEKKEKKVEGKENNKETEKEKEKELQGEPEAKNIEKWLNAPQSNELERRLKNPWQEAENYFTQGGGEVSGDNKVSGEKGEKVEKVVEEEKKEEKKTTYTDRILFERAVNKEKNEKIEKGGVVATPAEDNSTEKKIATNKTVVAYLRDLSPNPRSITPTNIKEITSPTLNTPKQSTPTPKESKTSDSEGLYKTKQSRSTELRDLVSQAIKDHKIFCIFDNHWYIVRPVREELLNRGWLEVIPDRRLIPRRRPPPMGPTYDREKTSIDHSIEAILTAKEIFADEIQKKVSKSTSFRITLEKPKQLSITLSAACKKSDESLTEVHSVFRIIPPTPEKKRNNFEIRDFVARYQLSQDKDRRGKDREPKSPRNLKKGKGPDSPKKPLEISNNPTEIKIGPNPLSKSLLAILNTINDNKKTIVQAASEIKNLEIKTLGKETYGVLFNMTEKSNKCLENKECLEKSSGSIRQQPSKDNSENSSRFNFSDTEAKMISKIIQSTNARIHFMWLSIKPAIHLKCFNYSPEIVNKFQKTTFCTKIGLWSHLSNIQWYAHEVHFPAKSPRMYNTGEADDLQAFFQDFQLTACIGLLKWLVDTFFDKGMKAVQTKKGKVPLKAFEFAIKQCERYMRFRENEDLGIMEEPKVLQEEWNTFLQWFYIITNDHGKVQESSSAQLMVVYTRAVETLRNMKKHWPEIDIDGRLNIWIMKPYCASCGRGIFMTNNVYYIGQHSRYIVQKYIEKPLLIYNTKFDIRQWFMITKLTPLEIWMYKECYLRFCTQPFALRNLHESVHLSNNSVQRKYVSFRDPSLPDQNMWDSNTFQLYLKTIGQPNAWHDIIYPGMRDAIVSTMLASQDTFDGPRRSWFEVYGADFMLSANLRDGPWLIEINENPAMDPSTKVTARLCPQMLRDVIKVVVDKKANKNASTGQWELIYRQSYSPSYGTVDLDVRGKKIAKMPPAVKIALNLPPHPSTTPGNTKRAGPKEMDPAKLYEVIKSYGVSQSKGDVESGTRKSKEKLFRLLKTVEKSTETSGAKIIKEKNVKNPNTTTENKPVSKQGNDKKEIGEQKAVPEVSKNQTQPHLKKEKNLPRKPVKEEKNLAAVVSADTPVRLKRKRVVSLSREAPKRGGSDVPERKGKSSTSDSRFPGQEKKVPGSQEQANAQKDKFKFTKFYKV